MNLYVILSDTFIGANVRYRSNQPLLELPDTAIFFQLNVINGKKFANSVSPSFKWKCLQIRWIFHRIVHWEKAKSGYHLLPKIV